jgi:tetratricopeptide (TPR) repeat protein
MADRILQIDPEDRPTQQMKARALSESGKSSEAAVLLESLTTHEPGDENAGLLFDEYLNAGQADKAATVAEQTFAKASKDYQLVFRAANVYLESKKLERAEELLDKIRKPMMEAGEHDPLAQSIARLAELRPGDVKPLEWLVTLYSTTSDSFRLPDALGQLAQAYEVKGNEKKALESYEQLLDRSPENERTRRKVVQLRAKLGLPPLEMAAPVKLPPKDTAPKPPAPPAAEPVLDEENQRFVTQALTDVDLFSSYGLTQKAIDVLDAVLERLPGHVPTLERLLDLSVAAGNDRRTVDLATKLKNIAVERNDQAAAERYDKFCRRFQQAAGKAGPEPVTAAPSAPTAPAVEEFSVPMIEAELDEAVPEFAPPPAESAVHEVDLSDEWAALSEQLEEPTGTAEADSAMQNYLPVADKVAAPPELVVPKAPEPVAPAAPSVPPPENIPAFELELQPTNVPAAKVNDPVSVDSFLDDLANEFASATSSLSLPGGPAGPSVPAPAPPARSVPTNGSSTNHVTAGPLSGVFEQFRSDMGESESKEEDPEVHYNLGVAYREMGLLDEAISEFQKVSRVPEFRYAMQCCTLLGLAFQEKGEPSIAAMWYERALMTPGLDQEAILALQYDLGISQELAGERNAAFQSFSKVYAMNIDYRDVAERMAQLVKARGDAP